MCTLRDYKAGDEAVVYQIVSQVLAEYGLSANPGATDSDLSDVHKYYISGGGVFRVLCAGGRLIGSYGLYPASASSCELRKMYLLPEFRGRGLGRKMMDDAIGKARALGFGEMILETNSCLKEARALYRKYGFAEFVPHHLSDRCDMAMKRML